MTLTVVQPGETRTRARRTPNFPIAGKMVPFGLYPTHIHPVLPGETMNSWECKWRVIGMPVKNPLFGAWLETWLVYVKLTDIDHALAKMFITNNMATSGFTAAGSSKRYFTKAGQIDYIRLATERVWHEYFANEGENLRTIDGVPQAKRADYNWTHNLMFKPEGLVEDELPSNANGQLTGLDIMTLAGMSELTYEKYLEQYGVSSAAAQRVAGRPEILRYARSWTQPTNNIDPVSGAPSSCWAWSDHLKADKPRRFDEPGFIIALSCIRPKMLSAAFDASFVGELWGFADFFPAYNLTDPAAGIKVIKSDSPVFPATGFGPATPVDLIYDHRDLLSHGEPFLNSNQAELPYPVPLLSTTSHNALSTDEVMRGNYPIQADIDAMFVHGSGTTDADKARRCVYYEGIASMEIMGHVKDTTL